jgi:hypothetical protein
MRVTIDWLRSLSVSVKLMGAAFLVGAIVALLMTSTNIAAIRGRVETLIPPPTLHQDIEDMTTLTYSAPLPGGGTLTLTVYKGADETADQFATRAAAEWAAVKAANGL